MPDRIDISPLSAITMLTIEAALAWEIHWALGVFGVSPGVPLFTFVSAVVAIRICLSLIHELGHVAAGRVLGMRWTLLKIHAFGMAVQVKSDDGHVRTASDQLFISVSGPAAGITASHILLLAANGLPGIPTAVLATPALVTIAGEFIYFIGSAPLVGDGNKAARAMLMILTGRRSDAFGA